PRPHQLPPAAPGASRHSNPPMGSLMHPRRRQAIPGRARRAWEEEVDQEWAVPEWARQWEAAAASSMARLARRQVSPAACCLRIRFAASSVPIIIRLASVVEWPVWAVV